MSRWFAVRAYQLGLIFEMFNCNVSGSTLSGVLADRGAHCVIGGARSFADVVFIVLLPAVVVAIVVVVVVLLLLFLLFFFVFAIVFAVVIAVVVAVVSFQCWSRCCASSVLCLPDVTFAQWLDGCNVSRNLQNGVFLYEATGRITNCEMAHNTSFAVSVVCYTLGQVVRACGGDGGGCGRGGGGGGG
jgi:hypothetical protein